MQIAQTNTAAKVAAIVAGLGFVAMAFVAAVPAKAALTSTQVSAIISLLQSFGADSATIANVQASLTGGTPSTTTGGSSSASTTFTKDLTMGSSGSDVTALQNFLIANGYSIPAGATGYFGSQTQAALAAYQTAKGISPAAGYFGPITRAAVNAGGTTTGGSVVVGLSGKGYLKNISQAGDVTLDIKEGDGSTQVLGVSADAQDGDVQIQRVEVTFTIENDGGSSNLDKYVSDIALYLDGKKIGSASPTSGTKDGRVWTYRFVDLSGVIKSGATGYLYVKVTPVSSIGSDEAGDDVTTTFTVNGIRAVGGDGISDTYVSTALDDIFTVSSAIAGTLTVSEASDNPKASQVAVSSSTTTGVKVLSLNLKAKNTSVKVNDLAVQLGTSDSLTDVVSTVKLMKGSTVLKTKTVSSGTFGTTTFDNINQTISKDSTENYSVVVDLKGDSAYADGTTLVASTTTYGWDVEDADGATVTPSAGVAGNTQTLTATGINVTLGTVSATKSGGTSSGDRDTASFSIPFTVTAGDSDVFIDGTPTRGASGSDGVAYGTTTTSTQGATQLPSGVLTASGTVTGDSAGNYYKVLANTSRTFTLGANIIASGTDASAGWVGLIINSIEYGPTSSAGSYYTSNVDTFKTSDIYIQLH